MTLLPALAATTLLATTVAPAEKAATGDVALTTISRSQWAYVLRATAARAAPSPSAQAVTKVPATTREGETNLVLTVSQTFDESGRSWVRVRLATLPNNSTAWLPRRALGDFHTVQTRLLVDRKRMTISLFRKARLVFRTSVGVGRQAWPTPRGEFYIRERLQGFGDPFYGPIALGTSGRSTRLTDWPGGGFIGIHGTDQPQLIPGRISHGCIRLRNRDIRRLTRLLPLGTPLTIR